MAKRRSLLSRVLRGVLWAVGGWLVLTLGLVLLLRWVEPPTTAFMLRDRSIAWWQEDKSYRFQHEWVDWKDISPQAKLAVIASEDQKFAAHYGFDLESISAALADRRKGGRTRGAQIGEATAALVEVLRANGRTVAWSGDASAGRMARSSIEDQINACVMPGMTIGNTITANSTPCPHNLRRFRIKAAINPSVNWPMLV